MQRVFENEDIMFKVSADKRMKGVFSVRFFTTDEDYNVEKTNADVIVIEDEQYIRLTWNELKTLGGGVLNYICRLFIDVENQSNGTYDTIYSRTTNYYVVAKVGHKPTGTINITENGQYDVTEYANADVAVPTTIEVDDELSETSENPVQNKVVTLALNDKADKSVETRVQTLYTELGERAMVSGIQVDTQSDYVDLQFPYKSGWGEDEDTSIKYVELSSATASKAGVMSAQDKEKLDDVYDKATTDALLNDKADKSTTYTKTEVDTALSAKANSTDLTSHTSNTDIHVTVAEKTTWNNKSDFSGNYNDLTNKPTIPTVPTNVSAFNNDAGYLTSHQSLDGYATEEYVGNYTYDKTTIDEKISEGGTFDPTQYYNKTATDALLNDKADKSTTYTKTEVDGFVDTLENADTALGGRIDNVQTQIQTIETELSGDYATKDYVGDYTYDKQTIDNKISEGGTFDPTQYYNKTATDTLLDAKADKSTTYTKTEVDTALASKANSSDLTSHTSNTDIHVTSAEKSTWNNKSDFSGSYNDLTDKPTIPTYTAGDGITITNNVISAKVWSGTKAQYEALTNKDADCIYLIYEA